MNDFEFQWLTSDDLQAAFASGELRNHPPQRESLPADLEARVRSLWPRVGRHQSNTYEQWELGFCRDRNPGREIALWEAIASVVEDRLLSHPHDDIQQIIA